MFMQSNKQGWKSRASLSNHPIPAGHALTVSDQPALRPGVTRSLDSWSLGNRLSKGQRDQTVAITIMV